TNNYKDPTAPHIPDWRYHWIDDHYPPIQHEMLAQDLGEVYIRCGLLDLRQGYAYFGHDNWPGRVTKVQLSHKGSIKGNKISLPANAAITGVNFYAHVSTPAIATSSGAVRL